MKKALSLLLVIALLITSMTFLSSCELFEKSDKNEKKESGFASGKGTEEEPYIISNAKQLKNLAKKLNDKDTYPDYADKYYKLSADIDLAGEEWEPINNGYDTNHFFKGVFDGDGYTVSNFKITNTTYESVGLFGSVSGTVKNLNVTQFEINFTHNDEQYRSVGGVVGILGGEAPCLENCTAEGEINATSNGVLLVGGVVGRTYSYGDLPLTTIKNCGSKVTVTAESTIENGHFESVGLKCGAFVGSLGTTTVSNCWADATVKATSKTHGSTVGIFAGSAGGSLLRDCFATGKAEMIRLAQDENQAYRAGYLGGLCGDASYSNLKIERSSFDGDLIATGIGNLYVGGLVGSMDGSITDSYATGTIKMSGDGVFSYSNNNGGFAGGLVGVVSYKVELINCYAANTIKALYTENYLSVGGLIGGTSGSSFDPILLKNCFSAANITANCVVTDPSLPTFHYDKLLVGGIMGKYHYAEEIVNVYLTEGQTILGIYNSQECPSTDLDKNFPVAESSLLHSAYFYMNTLSWDKTVWDLSNLGSYPTLLSKPQINN